MPNSRSFVAKIPCNDSLSFFIFPSFIEKKLQYFFNISSEIEKFYALKEKGILTEEEFDTEFEKESSDSLEKTEPIADIPDQIKKLSDLKDQGILTEEEFQSKKKDLLDKM